MLFPDSKLLIFSKAPIPGQVKTRLIPVLGKDGAAKLQQDMLEQKLRMATDNQIASIELYCWPDKQHPYFQKIQSEFQLTTYNQIGSDLGERMADAMRRSINDHCHAVIIGTDCPPLDQRYLIEAFQALENGADAVIGPANDGGYVLLGLSHFNQAIFNNIDWGGERVLSQTTFILKQLGFNYVELRTLWDVDRPEDLKRYTEYFEI